jgi:hypothetical protein
MFAVGYWIAIELLISKLVQMVVQYRLYVIYLYILEYAFQMFTSTLEVAYHSVTRTTIYRNIWDMLVLNQAHKKSIRFILSDQWCDLVENITMMIKYIHFQLQNDTLKCKSK